MDLEIDVASVYQTQGKPSSTSSVSTPKIPDSERACFRMALSNGCTVQDCPFSNDLSVITAHLRDKLRLFEGKGKSDGRSPQPKTILSRPTQQQQQNQKPRSRCGMVDGQIWLILLQVNWDKLSELIGKSLKAAKSASSI